MSRAIIIDWEAYERRVTELENEGMMRSDAQAVADLELTIHGKCKEGN